MISIVGIIVVLGSIVAGYLMEHGHLLVLFQPAEIVIILGAAIGTVIIANPLPVLKKIAAGLLGVFKGNAYTKALYTDNLKMLYDLFTYARKSGMAKLEEDVDNPAKSQIFSKHPKF